MKAGLSLRVQHFAELENRVRDLSLLNHSNSSAQITDEADSTKRLEFGKRTLETTEAALLNTG